MGKWPIPGLTVLLAVLTVVGLVCWPSSPQGQMPSTAPLPFSVPDLTDPEKIESKSPLRIEHVDWRTTSAFDTGSVHVLVKNAGAVSIRITRVLYDGHPVSTFGVDLQKPAPMPAKAPMPPESRSEVPDHQPIPSTRVPIKKTAFVPAYWSRITPSSVLAPNTVRWLTIKLVAPPTRRTPLVLRAVRIDADGELPLPSIRCWVERQPATLVLARLVFAPGGGRIYGYLRNDSNKPRKIHRLEVDGQDISATAWLPEKNIAADSMAVFSFQPESSFGPGAWVTVRAVLEDGSTIAGQTRALWGFPLGVESGGIPGRGFGLDPRTRISRPNAMATDLSGRKEENGFPDRLGGFNLMSCVLCPSGEYPNDRFGTAAELLRRHADVVRAAPGVPAIVNPCRARAEHAYPLFAETADALMVNPSVVTEDMPEEIRTRPIAATARLARLGRSAAEPNCYYPLVDTGKVGSLANTRDDFADPGELRARVFTLLAEGADGLLYRHAWNTTTPRGQALTHAIPSLNAEIRSLIPWLEIGTVAENREIDGHPELRLSTRWAGDKGLVAFIIRKKIGFGQASPVAETSAPALSLHVPLPSWARPFRVFQVTPEGLREWEEAGFAEGAATLAIPAPVAAAAYVVAYKE